MNNDQSVSEALRLEPEARDLSSGQNRSERAPIFIEDRDSRFGLLYKIGWIPLFPFVLIFTAFLKLKNRDLATDECYLEHQLEFFSFSKRIQELVGRELMPPSDKFHKFRQTINEYALSGQPDGTARVLDVATGCGFQASSLKSAGASEVCAIDYVHERLDVARRLCCGNGISLAQMDAARLSFPDDSFDAAVVSCALHDMPNRVKRKAIAEMVRVTRPQGNVVIFEPRTIGRPTLGSVLGLVGEALDESINMRDFIMDDLNPVLDELGLELVEEQNVYLFKILNIKFCRVQDSPTPV